MKNIEDDDEDEIMINKKKIILFKENLEYIDTKEIEQKTNEILKINVDKSIDDSNISKSIFLQKNKDNFPIFNGSFKEALNRMIRENKIKEINQLYQSILKEIKKIYYGYTHVEQQMYSKINMFIRFADANDNTPMQIVSKLKEILDMIKETLKFMKYLSYNFNCLKKIFKKIDEDLKEKLNTKSISLYFLLDIFDLPNNELSYILMYKIIDEVSCVSRYITDKLGESIEKENNNQINSMIINNSNRVSGNQSNLIEDKSSSNTSIDINAIINIKNEYVEEIYTLLDKLDKYNKFRVKYYNKYLYTKGNYPVDTNKFLYEDIDDDASEEFLQINSLMDEEIIIDKFLERSLINEFLDFFRDQLPSFHKTNENLIYLHLVQTNALSIITIFSFWNYFFGFLEIIFYFFGRIISKFFFNYLVKKQKMKLILICSNFIMTLAFILLAFDNHEFNYVYFNCIFKFLMGVSYCKNIETKFILNYIPKLLIKKNIKKYFRFKYFSFGLGFFLLALFGCLQNFIENAKKIDIIFSLIISFIILIINLLLFREPKIDDIINPDTNNKVIRKIIDNRGIEEKENIINLSVDAQLNDKTLNISYGKAKLISFKERSKAKKLENSVKFGIGKDNYEGVNQIFAILQKLMIKEDEKKSSYTNLSTIGHIIFLSILNIIISLILFYDPLINAMDKTFDKKNGQLNDNERDILDFKMKLWTFGISYLICFLLFNTKIFSLQKELKSWNNIILFIILFLILLIIIFLLSDPILLNDSPIIFDTYYYSAYYSIILLITILLEKAYYKIIIREIPLETTICCMNIDNFLDICENSIQILAFIILCVVNYYNIIICNYAYKIIIISLFIIELIVFLIFNYKRSQYSLIKIINKVTYESF